MLYDVIKSKHLKKSRPQKHVCTESVVLNELKSYGEAFGAKKGIKGQLKGLQLQQRGIKLNRRSGRRRGVKGRWKCLQLQRKN